MSTYEEKISQARQIILSHNQYVEDKINDDEVIRKLKASGGTTVEALALCQWEDLEKCSCPILLAKQIVKVFRDKQTETKPSPVVTEARAKAMTISELMERFDPRNHDNVVGIRLKEITRGKRCIVYNDDDTVNHDASVTLIEELRDGYPERDLFMVQDKPYPIFHLCESPNQFVNENPLYPNSLLRPDETCDQTNRSWKGIPEQLRLIVHLALIQTKEIRISSVDDAHRVLDLLAKATGTGEVAKRYSKAAILYQELKNEGRLPTLRLRKGQQQPSRANDPFFGGHRKY